MYNENIPTRAELPTKRLLIRSTIIAFTAALAIVVTIVMPSEYDLDPTGLGSVLGLTEMGQIKEQLKNEAEADRLLQQQNQKTESPKKQSSFLDSIASFSFISPAAAQTPTAVWKDEFSIRLKPGKSAELKLVMAKDATVKFIWKVEGGVANFDLHGDGAGRSISYKKGRGAPGNEGTIKAAFDGSHGWFWRNRTKRDITIILKTKGAYSEVKKYL